MNMGSLLGYIQMTLVPLNLCQHLPVRTQFRGDHRDQSHRTSSTITTIPQFSPSIRLLLPGDVGRPLLKMHLPPSFLFKPLTRRIWNMESEHHLNISSCR